MLGQRTGTVCEVPKWSHPRVQVGGVCAPSLHVLGEAMRMSHSPGQHILGKQKTRCWQNYYLRSGCRRKSGKEQLDRRKSRKGSIREFKEGDNFKKEEEGQ